MREEMEYQPTDHLVHYDGHEEWMFHFIRHGLDCTVTITGWPNGHWGRQSLVDARGLGVEAPPPPTGAERLLHHPATGRPRLSPIAKIGGGFPDRTLPKALEMALEQIDDYYLNAENK